MPGPAWDQTTRVDSSETSQKVFQEVDVSALAFSCGGEVLKGREGTGVECGFEKQL